MDPLTYLRAKFQEFETAAMRYQRWHLTSRTYLITIGVVTVLLQAVHMVLGGQREASMAVSFLSALCAASATGVTLAAGVTDLARRWVANRTGAEALKTEAFLYATGAAPYDGSNDAAELELRIIDIELMVDKLIGQEGPA